MDIVSVKVATTIEDPALGLILPLLVLLLWRVFTHLRACRICFSLVSMSAGIGFMCGTMHTVLRAPLLLPETTDERRSNDTSPLRDNMATGVPLMFIPGIELMSLLLYTYVLRSLTFRAVGRELVCWIAIAVVLGHVTALLVGDLSSSPPSLFSIAISSSNHWPYRTSKGECDYLNSTHLSCSIEDGRRCLQRVATSIYQIWLTKTCLIKESLKVDLTIRLLFTRFVLVPGLALVLPLAAFLSPGMQQPELLHFALQHLPLQHPLQQHLALLHLHLQAPQQVPQDGLQRLEDRAWG